MINSEKTTEQVINYLGLIRSPTENAWSKMIHHDVRDTCYNCIKECKQSNSTTFLYLFSSDFECLWHRFQGVLVWSFISGAPLQLSTGSNKRIKTVQLLGSDCGLNHLPVLIVDANKWQLPKTTGDWSLVSCTYASGYELDSVEIATRDWEPGKGKPTLSFPGEIWKPRITSKCCDFLENS